jgi:hypothetical protein
MKRLIGLIGASMGSALGWWIGSQIGLMTAFLVSTLLTGLGLYYATRIARQLLP